MASTVYPKRRNTYLPFFQDKTAIITPLIQGKKTLFMPLFQENKKQAYSRLKSKQNSKDKVMLKK
ncbi:hypothetical protein [Bacteroides cellulosilyticus]|uniref:hypothetical protein n=1 Tax=Bacteroides cellulosilyticus TaxID=246787 RepID=UPI0032BF5362